MFASVGVRARASRGFVRAGARACVFHVWVVRLSGLVNCSGWSNSFFFCDKQAYHGGMSGLVFGSNIAQYHEWSDALNQVS